MKLFKVLFLISFLLIALISCASLSNCSEHNPLKWHPMDLSGPA